MKLVMRLLPLFFLASYSHAQTNSPIVLWPEGAPGALGKADKDIPTLTPFLPEPGKATGAAIPCSRTGNNTRPTLPFLRRGTVFSVSWPRCRSH